MSIPLLKGFAVSAMPGFVRSDIPCPYCREPMRRYDDVVNIYRVVKSDGRDGVAQKIPLTCALVVCSKEDGGCNQRFVILKEGM